MATGKSRVSKPSEDISDTTAWKLIYGLRQSSGRFSCHRGPGRRRDAVGVASTRTHELRTALCDLDIQIRTTFTILQLELLLHLELELEDDVSQSSFESESDDESLLDDGDSDRDVGASQLTVNSRCMASLEKQFDAHNHPSFQPDNRALTLLRDLCSFLEARVNFDLIPIEPGDIDQASNYPRLARLLVYVQSLPIPPERHEFIPIPGSGPTPYLFNIAEDPATAAAFVALCDPARRRPPSRRAPAAPSRPRRRARGPAPSRPRAAQRATRLRVASNARRGASRQRGVARVAGTHRGHR